MGKEGGVFLLKTIDSLYRALRPVWPPPHAFLCRGSSLKGRHIHVFVVSPLPPPCW